MVTTSNTKQTTMDSSCQKNNLRAWQSFESERESLLSEGYTVVGTARMYWGRSYVLRNAANGNRITLRLRGNIIEIVKNNKLVKQYEV